MAPSANTPRSLDLKKDRGLTIEWADGSASYFTIAYLRRMSPSADMVDLREQMRKNPLTVLPSGPVSAGGGASGGDLVATGAEMVGNYAIRIRFSDGHATGIYSWDYLREIDPARARDPASDPTATQGPGWDAGPTNPAE